MQGGINNAGLFGASQREARSKLDQMAGIKRPSGILASSPELMRAAMPTAMAPAPMPMTAPAPMAMPMVPAPAPMPMPTTVSAAPTPAPAPRSLNPMAQAPAAGPGKQPVVKLNEGGEPLKGYSDMGARMAERAKASVAAGGSPVVDITQTAMQFMENLDKKTDGALTKKYGSLEAAEAAGDEKMDKVKDAAETKDAAAIADAAVAAVGEEVTDAAKMDFAENIFGLTDVNDIDEINRRIANVAIGSAVGKGPDKFAEAVLFGLQTVKQTAAARAAAAAGGKSSGFEPLPRYAEALPDMVKTIMTNNPGITAQEAAQQAALVLDPLYNKAAGGGSTTAAPMTPLEKARKAIENGAPRDAVIERLKSNGIDPGDL